MFYNLKDIGDLEVNVLDLGFFIIVKNVGLEEGKEDQYG